MNVFTPVAPTGATRSSVAARGVALSGRWLKSRWFAAVLVAGIHTACAQVGSQSVDIGTSTIGATSESDGVVTITASGADIWEQADEFRYRYQAWTGDGVMTARLSYVENTDDWAKAAVMFRETLAANSRHAMMAGSSWHGTAFQYRPVTGIETATSPPSERHSGEGWLRITRVGDTLTGFVSADGVAWTQTGTITLAGLPASIYVGLAVTSHNDGVLCTAQFDNITVSGSVPPPPSTQPPQVASFTIESTNQNSSEMRATYRLVFTESVTGVDTTDFTGVNISGSPELGMIPEIQSVTGTGASYAIAVRMIYNSSSGGQFRIDLNAGGTGIKDVDGNALSGAATGPVVKTAGGPWPIMGVVAPTSGTYTTGQAIAFNVDYGVSGMTVTGTPRIALTIGAVTRYATYVGPLPSSFGRLLVFQYVVQAIDSDADGITMNGAIELNGGTIRGGNGADGLLTFTPPNTSGIMVGGTTPPTNGWDSRDIGTATAGSTTSTGTTLALSGSGWDIWGTSDGFRMTYQSLTGDGSIVARVSSVQNTSGWAKAGVMLRDSLNADAANVFVAITPEHGTVVQYRTSAANGTGQIAGPAVYAPYWLRLTRNGNVFSAATSTDGVTWSVFATINFMTLSPTVYAGLAVTSHNDGTLSSAMFDNVSLASTGSATSPPAAPTSLAATSPTPYRIQLTWTDNASNETGYEIQRSTDNVTFTTILNGGGAGLTSYADNSVLSSTTYYYRVRAVNSAGASAFSNVAAQTTLPESASWTSQDVGSVAARGNVNLTSLSSGTISGSGADIWGNADACQFMWRRLTGDGNIVARITGMSDTNAWAKAGVMIRESLGPGARNVFTCVTPERQGIVAQARSVAGDVTSNSAGPGVNAPYWLRLSRNGSTFTAAASPDGVSWTTFATYAIAMDAATYIGLAVTSHNDGTMCAATFDNVTITTGSAPPPGTAPSAPTNLVATASAWNRVDLTWNDNAANETGYEIQMSTDPTGFATQSNVGANVTSATVNGLFQENVYYFRVRAFNAAGASSFSNVASATTLPYPAPATLGAPTNLRATATSVSTIALSWTDNSSSELGFEVGMSTDGVNYDWSGKTLANATSGQAAGLRGGTQYYFQVRAYQDGGTFYIHSASSNTVTATTFASPPPSPSVPTAPSNLTATVASSSQINLMWVDNSNDETGFEISRSTDNVSYTRIATTSANSTANHLTHSDTGLTAGTTYYYYVRAVNGAGPSSPTNTATATTTTAAPLPTWAFADIGAVGVAGANNSSGNTITISGSGSDIWDRADAFRFVYRAWTGDGVVEARVASMDNTNEWAKAGVMIRETLDANAKNAFLCVTPGYHGALAQARSNTGEITGQTQGPFANAPYWVRLVRTGNDFHRYFSVDGVNWIDHGYFNIPMSSTVYFGFVVTSHDNARLNTAVFSDPFVGTR